MKNPQVHICMPGLALSSILQLCILLTHSIHHGSTNTVKSQQHGEAVLSFHFSFISGPEDLHVSIMKMELIGDTEPLVICTWHKGTEVYPADQYRNRTEIRNDLPSGKLELILKHVEESDAGLYTCQAANKKNYGEKMIQLYVEIKERAVQNVTSQQHEAASLPFHFSFISGPEDLHVSVMKMETIAGDTKPTVICALKQGVPVYHAAQYRDRTEIRNDLPSGKLELILKHVVESDAGIYKCQAANKKNHGEKMIQLYIKQKIINTSNAEDRPNRIGVIFGITCLVLTVCLFIIVKYRSVWVPYFTRNRNKDNLKSPLPVPYEMVNKGN